MPRRPTLAPRRRWSLSPSLPLALTLALTLALSPLACVLAGGPARAEEPPAAALLERAFANRYDVDATAQLEMLLSRDGSKPRRRVLEIATRRAAGAYHALGQITYPDYLRGMTLLTISKASGRIDAFVYMPSLGRSRRISLAHRDDAFLGSDLTYQDFERRYPSDCEAVLHHASPGEVEASEPVHVVSCKPQVALRYARALFVIARSDAAILEIREYEDEDDTTAQPYRTMRAFREAMVEVDGHVLPTRVRFERPAARTATDVTLRYLRAERVRQSLFTVSALERKPDLALELRRHEAAKEAADGEARGAADADQSEPVSEPGG